MSKERVLVVVEEEECRGEEEEDWRCRRATGIWVEAAQDSSQLFVEAHSSKGQAFSAIACTLQFLPEVMAPQRLLHTEARAWPKVAASQSQCSPFRQSRPSHC